MEKDDIIAEVRRTTQENGGKPLGVDRFAQITGIKPYDWSKYWPRFSEVQRAAGLEPNQLMGAYPDDYMLERLAELARELKHFPVKNELRIKKHNDSGFPSTDAYQRLGNKTQLITKLFFFCKDKAEYADVAKVLEPIAVKDVSHSSKVTNSSNNEKPGYGFVYLVKGHPGEYKIGRTNLVDRRLSELGATASVEQALVHEIKTDDPAGIESYWHKRFQEKRMRGEWFRLSAADVKAFKRWRRIL